MLADYYPVIKAVHVGLALLSGGVFAGRGLGVLLGARAPVSRPVRRCSMLIDIALLSAALLLLAALRLDPFALPWLRVKLVLLVGYIVLGMLALRWARSIPVRALAYGAALLCYSLIIVVARTHDPLGGMFGAG